MLKLGTSDAGYGLFTVRKPRSPLRGEDMRERRDDSILNTILFYIDVAVAGLPALLCYAAAVESHKDGQMREAASKYKTSGTLSILGIVSAMVIIPVIITVVIVS